ncbi:MAG: autotransporter domain-containing protein [Acetobacteraceae bacterium]|nr:autotransporter domain-containing protein [Acetobacteraceae bacterium]
MLRATALASAGVLLSLPALAAATNTTAADVNLLNLLSPFLSLNGTTTGQQTLTTNLSQALATNALAASSPTIEATSISDKTIFGGSSTSITLPNNSTVSYGPGANLAGGLPVQAVQSAGGIAPYQQYGGLGSLGGAYQAAVSPSGATAPAVVSLLNAAYTFNSTDLGVAKFYFANGTNNGTTAAVAPSGYTLPTANGLPNATNSVYDLAYGVINTGSNQDIYGDSRPVQVAPTGVNGYDPTALSGLATNPSFPSGHTTYAYTDSILIGMLTPQLYQSMLLRASEYGNSRISLGVHYPLDIIGSRALAAYDLANLLNGNSGYTTTNAVGSTTSLNLASMFAAAQPQLTAALGGTSAITAAAANNPYNAYSQATYSAQGSTNAAIYAYRLTYGLPTLSLTAAPREQAPAGGPDASILLAPIYGGSTAAAQTLAPTGGLYGNLATGTINQIIVNTETNALAAFYGTSLSYWTRINLYDAIGYFQGVTGTISLASSDQVLTNVTVANTGVLSGTGTIGTPAAHNSVEIQSGGTLYPGVRGETTGGKLTVNGPVTFDAGSTFSATGYLTNGATSTDSLAVNGNLTIGSSTALSLNGTYLPGVKYSVITVNGGTIAGSFASAAIAPGTGLGSFLTVTPQYAADPSVFFVPQSHFVAAATTPNQAAVAAAIDASGNSGSYGANGTTLLTQLVGNTSAAAAPAAFDALSGEGLAAQQAATLEAGNLFADAIMSQMTQPADGAALQAGSHRAWASGFGQHDTWDGDSGTGSAKATGTNAGFAAGIDFQITPQFLAGFAAGYSNSDFSARDTTGQSDGAHFGLYGKGTFGDAYLAATMDYTHFDNTTDRAVAFSGVNESEKGTFGSDEWLGRIEGGYQFRFGSVNATPFVGFQAASLGNGGFQESNNGGTGIYGLQVSSHDAASQKTFLGAQVDTAITFGNGMTLKPFARLDWEHEFTTDRTISASLLSLPGSFTVNGPQAGSDVGRLNAGVKASVGANVVIYAAFDGAVSDRGNSYAGTGGLKIVW